MFLTQYAQPHAIFEHDGQSPSSRLRTVTGRSAHALSSENAGPHVLTPGSRSTRTRTSVAIVRAPAATSARAPI